MLPNSGKQKNAGAYLCGIKEHAIDSWFRSIRHTNEYCNRHCTLFNSNAANRSESRKSQPDLRTVNEFFS